MTNKRISPLRAGAYIAGAALTAWLTGACATQVPYRVPVEGYDPNKTEETNRQRGEESNAVTSIAVPYKNSEDSELRELEEFVRKDPKTRVADLRINGRDLGKTYCLKSEREGKEYIVEVNSHYIALHDVSSEESYFLYDLDKDRKADRLIFTQGKVSEAGKAFIDLEGLFGTEDSDIEMDLNGLVKSRDGKNPYNTRMVFDAEKEGQVKALDFDDEKTVIFEGEEGKEWIKKIRNFYDGAIERFKGVFDIK